MSCSSDRSPSRQSSSSGDLLPEMMESKTPPLVSSPHGADDPEVSSQRISPDPPRPKGNPAATRSPEYSAPKESHKKCPGLSGARPDALMSLLEQVAISEACRTLMGTVFERISSAESGLHEAFMSLLRGFEVREVICIFLTVPHMLGVPYADSSPSDSSCRPEVANRGS